MAPEKMTRERADRIKRQLKVWETNPPKKRKLRKTYRLRQPENLRDDSCESESASSGAALKDAIGRRFEAVIQESDDPERAMEELAHEAEKVGLIDSSTAPRRDSVWQFVMDLWDENPVVLARMNLQSDTLNPESIVDLGSALDALR